MIADRFRPRELAIVFTRFTIGRMVLTLLLWPHPTRRLPSSLIDTPLNAWIVGWDADRLRHGSPDGPAFFSYRNILAFSDSFLGIALVVAAISERSLVDSPREVMIAATGRHGATSQAVSYPEFIARFLRDPTYPRITISRPSNQAVSLTFQATATAIGRWWSVPELELWRRTAQ